MIKKALSISCFKKYILWLLAGFIIGAIICGMFSHEVISGNKEIFSENLKLLKNSSITGSSIFSKLIGKRFLIILALALVGLSGAGKSLMNIFLLWSGMGCGIFITAFIKLSGIKALFVALCFFLPQYIVYIPVLGILYCQIHKFHGTYSWKNKEFRTRKKGVFATPFTEYIIAIMILMLCVFVGIVLEAFVNPILIKKVLTIL